MNDEQRWDKMGRLSGGEGENTGKTEKTGDRGRENKMWPGLGTIGGRQGLVCIEKEAKL
jgi:hypothetical protein